MKDKSNNVPIIKQEGYLKADQIDGSVIVFAISKREVNNHDTYRIQGQLRELKMAGKVGKNTLALEFHGYDNDPREVYQINEIRAYLRGVFNKCPELFYFLNIETYTFTIAANSIFTNFDEVKRADAAALEFAANNNDDGKVITVDYYTKNQREFHR